MPSFTPLPALALLGLALSARLPAQENFEVRRIHVRLEIHDASVQWTLDETLHNLTGQRQEAHLLLPIPRDAAVQNFEFWMNGKPCAAELLSQEKAAEIYESIVRRARDPALLEFFGYGMLQARIFPLEPHGEARIRTTLTFPATSVGSLFACEIPLYVPAGNPEVTVEANLDSSRPLGPVFSPDATFDVVRDGPRRARASREGPLGAQRRLTLYYGPGGTEPGVAVLCHKTGDVGHFLMTLHAPLQDGADRLPRDVVFVLDRSGSMRDGKLEQAIAALQYGLSTLHKEDRFEVITFATEATPMRGMLTAASPGAVAQARESLARARAAGGTALSEALGAAFGLAFEAGRMAMVVLLTDGEPTVGVTDPDELIRLTEKVRPDGRVFCFGVGHDVNTQLLDRLAECKQGVADYILPEENIELRVSAFFDRISQPALHGVSVELEGLPGAELFPRHPGDLYAGSAVHLVGTYPSGGAGKIVVRGMQGTRPFEKSFPVQLESHQPQHESVRQLYAARKVAYLVREIRRNGASTELREEVIRLGREYGIVTPFTAALVVEEGELLAGRTDRDFRGRQWEGVGFSADAPAAPAEQEVDRALREVPQLAAGKKAVDTLASLRRLETRTASLDSDSSSGAMAPPVRHIGNKVFLQIGSTWIDRSIEASRWEQRRVVVAFSDEYFALLREEPSLHAYLALGDDLLVQSGDQILEIRPAPGR